ncbi:MAG TPA: class I SAM-dependent methyltransferase [Geobacteraceae bacterium]|nr:class I SAM-dependent methyltransferase [Geobacteraceae bacterium]
MFDKEYFRQFYGDYCLQSPARKSRLYLEMIRGVVPVGRLLDIGCSFGMFLREAVAYFTCTGMDVSPEVVAVAAVNVPDAVFIAGKLPDIPFSNMDVITALDVIEHVADPEAALVAIKNALRPGGVALVVVPVYDGPLGWLTGLLDKDPTHLHKKSRSYWLELAGRNFEVIEWQGFLRKLLFGRWYLHLPMRRLRFIAPAVGLLLQRPA